MGRGSVGCASIHPLKRVRYNPQIIWTNSSYSWKVGITTVAHTYRLAWERKTLDFKIRLLTENKVTIKHDSTINKHGRWLQEEMVIVVLACIFVIWCLTFSIHLVLFCYSCVYLRPTTYVLSYNETLWGWGEQPRGLRYILPWRVCWESKRRFFGSLAELRDPVEWRQKVISGVSFYSN